MYTESTTYGPNTPIVLDITMPNEMPVWRRHVGYVSDICRNTENTVTPAQNLMTIDRAVANAAHSESAAKVKYNVCVCKNQRKISYVKRQK